MPTEESSICRGGYGHPASVSHEPVRRVGGAVDARGAEGTRSQSTVEGVGAMGSVDAQEESSEIQVRRLVRSCRNHCCKEAVVFCLRFGGQRLAFVLLL